MTFKSKALPAIQPQDIYYVSYQSFSFCFYSENSKMLPKLQLKAYGTETLAEESQKKHFFLHYQQQNPGGGGNPNFS